MSTQGRKLGRLDRPPGNANRNRLCARTPVALRAPSVRAQKARQILRTNKRRTKPDTSLIKKTGHFNLLTTAILFMETL